MRFVVLLWSILISSYYCVLWSHATFYHVDQPLIFLPHIKKHWCSPLMFIISKTPLIKTSWVMRARVQYFYAIYVSCILNLKTASNILMWRSLFPMHLPADIWSKVIEYSAKTNKFHRNFTVLHILNLWLFMHYISYIYVLIWCWATPCSFPEF